MSTFRHGLRAELHKTISVRSLAALPVGVVVYALISSAPLLTMPEADRRAIGGDALVHALRGPGFVAAVAMLVLGALAAGVEFRHRTMATTLLVTPRRGEVLAAKAVAMSITAAVTALAAEAVVLLTGVAFLRSNGIASTAAVGDLVAGVVAVLAVAVLYGLAGLGLGLLVRDPTAAVGGALLWIGIVEGAIPIVLRKPWLFKWLPAGAANAVIGVADPPGNLLAPWAGGLIVASVAAALVAGGALVLATADVD